MKKIQSVVEWFFYLLGLLFLLIGASQLGWGFAELIYGVVVESPRIEVLELFVVRGLAGVLLGLLGYMAGVAGILIGERGD